ncbi:MerR family transcriptional regulator [Amycolatopsis jejuensis]|uniref:DNA polymerase III subunit beta family protein n=1 Tax=Amycolatopsis jejuensis TaxID=330084 RepID=UPI0005269763|nr:MerR family transcriptional regulator [Amycolatopsis jejuensis]
MSDLLPIGAFARACGLTASALRFYADSGLVPPLRVDDRSGYRYYSSGQVAQAVQIRRLREIGLPLDRIADVLAADPAEAARIIDDQVAGLSRHARQARETAAEVKAALGPAAQAPSIRVGGAVFSAAVEQVLTATSPELPVLNGVHLEVSADGIVLTATDRYRLATRTLVPAEASDAEWSATIDADELRLAMSWTRRQHELTLSRNSGGVFFVRDSTVRTCRVLAEPFPDYRLMMGSLPEVVTRAVVSRNAFVAALENHYPPRVRLDFSSTSMSVAAIPLDAVVTGPEVSLEFAMTTLHPAVSTAVGPDVMLDVAGPDLPMVVRSADHGDLTTLAMPLKEESAG